MEVYDEIRSFIKVWIIAIASQVYCHYVAATIPTKSLMRLISLLPIFYLLIMLPLNLHSIYLGSPSAFFLGSLANLKLILFSFDSGPLSPPPKNFLHFVSIALLPITIKKFPKTSTNNGNSITKKIVPNKYVLWAIKIFVLIVVIHLRKKYRQNLQSYVLTTLLVSQFYLSLEMGFALSVALPQAILGLELEPHFNEPYFSTSLQDFWGRRWNIVVPNILRPLVYHPVGHISTSMTTDGATVAAKKTAWSQIMSVISVFTMSGLIHELLFYQCTHEPPTGEMMVFFVVQGVCLVFELHLKKALAHRVRLPRLVSGLLTLVILIVTADWFFFPRVIRTGAEAKSLDECVGMLDFVKDIVSYLLH